MRRELQCSADLQPLILDLNFWHRSFLTTIMVDHYPLFEFPCDSAFCMQQNKNMFIMIIIINDNVCIKASYCIALCYVALAPPPRRQHQRCFHLFSIHMKVQMYNCEQSKKFCLRRGGMGSTPSRIHPLGGFAPFLLAPPFIFPGSVPV